MRFGIIYSEWNHEITLPVLKDGAYNTLIKNGALEENILISLFRQLGELTLVHQLQLKQKVVDVVICLGCVF